MAIRPLRYRSLKAQGIKDAATRLAFEDLATKVEQLAREASAMGDGFPSGACVFWLGAATDIPAGWSIATELEGRFPRGMVSGGTPGAVGGTDKHTHGSGGILTGGGATSGMNPISSGTNMRDGTGTSIALANFPHGHNIAETTTLPPYVDGIWIRKD